MSLNATISATDANSYVTQEEANTYFSDRVHASDWEDFEYKDEVLITSSQMLDWYINWKGFRASTTQSMLWPRTDVIRRDSSEVDDGVIPNEVKVAVYELALSSLDEDRTGDNELAGIDQLKAGSLMIKASSTAFDAKSTAKEAIPEKIHRILSDLRVLGGASVVRLLRA